MNHLSSMFKNQVVLVSGHTGFKGSWLSIWLTSMGSIVKGYSLEPPTTPSLYAEARIDELLESTIGDIRNQEEHHKVKSFSEEYDFFMEKYGFIEQ